jgi:cytochrome c
MLQKRTPMKKNFMAMAIAAAFSGPPAWAQFTYPGCADLKSSDFKMTEVFNRKGGDGVGGFDAGIAEPVQMDLHAVRKGSALSQVDIYFVERLGNVKHFDGGTKKITTMGKIDTRGVIDNGLMGIALHPDFDANHWLYVWYCPNKLKGQNRLLRLARFTETADHKLDMASEKILIEILGSRSDAYHSGGPMTFDSKGDLWVTVGNNSPDLNPATCNVMSKTDSTQSGEWGPSNTANLRGGIFRIHPDASAKGYSIPAGNFGDYWAGQWDAQGKTALAAQYRDPAKVLPEVYVKGDRSNYSISVHPTRRWLAWGVVNYSYTNEEFNLVTHPVFAGYPYFHQNNVPTCTDNVSNAGAPKNNSPLSGGVVDLPPAMPSTLTNLAKVAMTGPIYAFDRGLASATKFPPHLNETWINMSWQTGQMHISTLDTNKAEVLKTQRVDDGLFGAWKFRNPLQAKYGPEGSLYVLNYDGFYTVLNPGVFRIDYVGSCRPAVSTRKENLRTANPGITLRDRTLSIRESGAHEFSLYDLGGKLRARRAGSGEADYPLWEPGNPLKLEKGVYTLRVHTAKGSLVRNLSLF